MKEQPLRMCTVCRKSHHRGIKNVKNAFLENTKNIPANISKSDLGILEDYSHKNIIKKPEHAAKIFKLILPTSSLWKNGREIKIAFMGGRPKIKDRIKEIASEWLTYANLDFVYTKDPAKAQVRISFNRQNISDSAVGTDCLTYDNNEATMRFGWLNKSTTDEDFRSVVLHEFGHMIGCGHEHESPKDGGVPWNKKKAYAHYMKELKWSKDEVDFQIFEAYKISHIRGTKIDKDSIMMYPIPNEITIGDFEVGWNDDLSKGDKSYIKRIYPNK